METQDNSATPALEEKASETSPAESEMTRTSLHNNGAIRNEKVQEDLTSEDDGEATSVPPRQVKLTVIERITKGKAVPSLIYSQVGGSQSSQSTLSTKEAGKEIVEFSTSTQIHSHLEQEAKREQEMETQRLTSALPNLAESTEETMETQTKGPTPALEKKASETSPAESEMTRTSPHTVTESSMKRKVYPSSIYSQSNQSTMTTEETRYPSVEEGPELEKATEASLCQGVAGPSSQISEIGEILEVMELKDGEQTLLAKLLELYPQLRLSRDGRRNCKIIAASYRVLCDILLMLTTKTPCTITASDKTTLSENLDAATFYGFDKDWIGSVRAVVFDGLVAEEVLFNEIETYGTALEQVDRPFLLLEQ